MLVTFSNTHLLYITSLGIRILTIHPHLLSSVKGMLVHREAGHAFVWSSVSSDRQDGLRGPATWISRYMPSAGWLQIVGFNSVYVSISRKYLKKEGKFHFFWELAQELAQYILWVFLFYLSKHTLNFSGEDILCHHWLGDVATNLKPR